jgi:hypothetical protein
VENAELRWLGHSSSSRVAALQCAVRFTRFARSSGLIYKNEVKQHVTEYQKQELKKVTGKKCKVAKSLLYFAVIYLVFVTVVLPAPLVTVKLIV